MAEIRGSRPEASVGDNGFPPAFIAHQQHRCPPKVPLPFYSERSWQVTAREKKGLIYNAEKRQKECKLGRLWAGERTALMPVEWAFFGKSHMWGKLLFTYRTQNLTSSVEIDQWLFQASPVVPPASCDMKIYCL